MLQGLVIDFGIQKIAKLHQLFIEVRCQMVQLCLIAYQKHLFTNSTRKILEKAAESPNFESHLALDSIVD